MAISYAGTYADNIGTPVTLGEMMQRGAFLCVTGIESAINRLADWNDRRVAAEHLARMPDHLLQDIGVVRADIKTAVGL